MSIQAFIEPMTKFDNLQSLPTRQWLFKGQPISAMVKDRMNHFTKNNNLTIIKTLKSIYG